MKAKPVVPRQRANQDVEGPLIITLANTQNVPLSV